MTGPALRALGRSPARACLTLLTSPSGAEAAALMPEVDEVMVFDAPWMKTVADGGAEGALRLVAALREAQFDAAAIFTVCSQSPLPAALVCYLADIPLRLAHCHENPYQLLTDWLPDPEPRQLIRHEVRRQLDLVAHLGFEPARDRLAVRVPDPARARMGRILAEIGLDPGRPWTVVHPGATAPSRRYPPELFAAVVRRLTVEHGWQIVFSGSAEERTLVDAVRASSSGTSLAGELSLAELAALLERAPLLIANNTGPVHLACAVGTPVVDLYALTNPQHTPWGVASRVLSHDVPCRNCYRSVCPEGHQHCLSLVEPDEVVRAALDLYAAR